MKARCFPFENHALPSGVLMAARGGCKHKQANDLPYEEFGRLPIIHCELCGGAMGRLCPECKRVF